MAQNCSHGYRNNEVGWISEGLNSISLSPAYPGRKHFSSLLLIQMVHSLLEGPSCYFGV